MNRGFTPSRFSQSLTTWAEYIAGALADKDLPPQAVAGTGRLLALQDRTGLRQQRWAIDLPGAGRLVAERKRQQVSADGRTNTWVGALRGAAGGMVSISQTDGFLSGFLDDGKRYWVIESAGKGLYRLFELDTSKTPPPAGPLRQSGDSGSATTSTTQADGGTVIQDVLVAYTPEVVTR
jgi:hypothetical protein